MTQNDPKTWLSIEHLTAQNGSLHALMDMNLTLFPGEVHAIVSFSSSDLSALVDFFSGKLDIVSGAAFMDRKELTGSAFGKQINVVSQSTDVIPTLTPTENIYLNSVKRFRFQKKKEQEECQKLLDRLSIHMDLNCATQELTNDEKILIPVLRAYLKNQKIIVFRDIMSDLEIRTQESLIGIWEAMKNQGRTVVYITSHLEDALRVSDRVSVMYSGSIVETQDIQNAVENPEKLMSSLTGWRGVCTSNEANGAEFLKRIVNARRVLTSELELRKEIIYIAEDILKVLHGDCCLVCLADLETGVVTEALENKNDKCDRFPENDLIVCEIIEKDHFVVIDRNTPRYNALFAHHDEMHTLLCAPVKRVGKISSLLMIFYRNVHKLSEMDQFYMNTFGKEIAIALETSDLIGKSILLQESHHRIKNNLQTIVSLVYMQKQLVRKNKADASASFDAIIRQISSIATIHDLLASDSGGSSIVNLATIVRELLKFYSNRNVQIELDMENISIPYNKATSIAIIVNEILVNCFKHAFVGREEEENRISILLRNNGLSITIRIADNGRGFPERQGEEKKRNGIGTFLIDNIVKSTGGTATFENSNGAVTTISVPISRTYEAKNSAI